MRITGPEGVGFTRLEECIMKHEKIQIVPPNALKTKWSRAIRYGDLIFTTAHSAARPDGTMPTTDRKSVV